MEKQTNLPDRETSSPIERELRLIGDRDALQAVFASPLASAKSDGQEQTVDLENRYLDTRDHRLRDKGLAFRVRNENKGQRQTLKAGDDAHGALLKRGEWETPIKDGRPRLDALPRRAQRLIPKGVKADDLTTVFRTTFKRRLRRLQIDRAGKPATIEAALDLGMMQIGEDRQPVAEIELELVEGAPATLYQIALELQEKAPLRLETRSKSNRAFESVTGLPPAWHRATTPMLTRDDSVDQVMSAIFRSCFEQWLANQAAAIDGRDSEGVHQMRVGLRRLRSALSIFRKRIPKSQLAWLQEDAKQTANTLGPARDWDVFLEELLAPLIQAQPEDKHLKALLPRAKARRAAAYRTARKRLADKPYTRFLLRFGQWLEDRAWQEGQTEKQAALGATPVSDFAAKLLTSRRDRALVLGKNFVDLPVEERHQLRIALKKLRYAVEFFAPLFDKKAVKPFVGSMKALQDDLGHLNDVAVAETLLDDLVARPGKVDIRQGAGMVIGWHARGVFDMEASLIRDWSTFAKRAPFWA